MELQKGRPMDTTGRVDDSCAREEWGWKPAYDLESMTVDMLEKLCKINPGLDPCDPRF